MVLKHAKLVFQMAIVYLVDASLARETNGEVEI
jgi:hypothetical protein